jgi:hypothetical protein
MNAERLHAVCLAIKTEMDSQTSVAALQQVVNFISRVVSQPQQPNHQAQLGTVLTQFYEKLRDAPSDRFSPAWRQTVDELGGSDLLGSSLVQSVRAIFERNQITPSVAQKEVQSVFEALQKFAQAIDSTVTGLSQIGIGAEKLAPGECELGILVPRHAVKDSLKEFGEELQDLDFILSTFSEVATGKRDSLPIKTISSSDLMVFLAALPPVAACVAHAAERLINAYKTLLEIRKLQGELKKQGLKDDEMTGIGEHANAVMTTAVEDITVEVIEQYFHGKDKGRKNELTNAVRISLNKLANRIDAGFSVEVRAEPPKKPKAPDATTPEEKTTKSHIDRVMSASQALRFMNLTGNRILHLPEKTVKEAKPKKTEESNN